MKKALLAFYLVSIVPLPVVAQLRIVAAAVRQIEDGPPAPMGTRFVPGETVYFSFQVTGYRVSAVEPETRKVHLSYKIEAFDPQGVNLVEPIESVLDTSISDQDKDWKPKIRAEIMIPPFAPPGKYKIRGQVSDDTAKTKSESEIVFEVSGRAIDPSPVLTVRDFGFYRSEDDTQALTTAAFRAGDTLFARFDMTGFRFGDRNTIDLSYDVAVLNPEGKQIYQQLEAAVEKSFSFYPKPFVPGSMNLSLQPDMRKGTYTVVLTVHDRVGKQDYEVKHPFDVD